MSGCEGPGVCGGLSPAGGETGCPGDPGAWLRVEQLEHRQRYRVSMSSNPSETENTMLTRKNKSQSTNMNRL